MKTRMFASIDRITNQSDRPSIRSFEAAITEPERISGRSLDLCLLAVCSFALSLLCHQPVHITNAASGLFSTPGATPTANPVRIDFLIKAGLLTTQKQALETAQDDE